MATATLSPTLSSALETAEARLLEARSADGHWRGRLAASALSTATASVAITEVDRQLRARGSALPPSVYALAERGRRWLANHANDDGGWGDTTRSASNLSTTVLCWAALTDDPDLRNPRATHAARSWIVERAGGVEPEKLKPAIEASYGEDRTFSIPILTLCALAGVLGPRQQAFQGVTRLPFELAALPQSWFRFLGLPVVSYALPALIAVGQVQHRYRPSKHWSVRTLRNRLLVPTRSRLRAIQPTSGGFLEAIPLTAFVTMSLAGAGHPDHPVAQNGIRFLSQAARDDGCWPIDIDLATWVSTLSVLALSVGTRGSSALEEALPRALAERDIATLRDWLLDQQYQQVHPYTGAPAGGWAWTDLPGGVPDADDTAGALLALRALGATDSRSRRAAESGILWLLGLENRDGGIPTFCRGWGKLPFDQSAPDLTAHTLRALTAWQDDVAGDLGRRIEGARQRMVRYLAQNQRPDGAWIPLWFGNEQADGFVNPTYGTTRTLRALTDLGSGATEAMRLRARDWLLRAQHPNGGWGGDRGVAPSLEETALAVDALADDPSGDAACRDASRRGAAFIARRIAEGDLERASPIGFYFANLWYFEDLYPAIFAVSALRRAVAAGIGPPDVG